MLHGGVKHTNASTATHGPKSFWANRAESYRKCASKLHWPSLAFRLTCFMAKPAQTKKFLFISDSDSDAARSRLAVAGIPYIKKRLESGSANWQQIIGILEDESLIGVLVKLSNGSMERMLLPEYDEVHDKLLSKISALSHIVFVHSSFLGLGLEQSDSGEDEEDTWFGPNGYFYVLEDEQRVAITELFNKHQLNVVPYRRNVELSMLASEFIESRQSNLIFRFYMPSGKIYAEQTYEVLSLFRDYLTQSLGMRVRQSTHSTTSGVVYEFFGDGDMSEEDVTSKFTDFSKVMDLCIIDPQRAEQLLVEQGADAQVVGRLVSDYSKKLRRITSDIRQERERKILEIRHRLEDELIEVASDAELYAIRNLVDQVVPAQDRVGEVMGLGTRLGRVGGGMVVNVRPQFINHVTGVVAQEVYGDQHIGPEPSQLLELIRERGTMNAIELQSAVYELEDADSSPEKRLSSARRLQAFLSRVGGKLGDKALDASIGMLQAYIQSKLGI